MTAPMFPLMLNLVGRSVFVVGEGDEAAARAKDLAAHGADPVVLFRPDAAVEEPPGPSQTGLSQAGPSHAGPSQARWPTPDDFARYAPSLVFATTLPDDVRDLVIALARRGGALVHIQDRIEYCDFHLPARLRRGRLLVTVSTDGAVAGLSRLLRDHLGSHVFSEAWAERLEEIAGCRSLWKTQGLRAGALFAKIAGLVESRGWLGR